MANFYKCGLTPWPLFLFVSAFSEINLLASHYTSIHNHYGVCDDPVLTIRQWSQPWHEVPKQDHGRLGKSFTYTKDLASR